MFWRIVEFQYVVLPAKVGLTESEQGDMQHSCLTAKGHLRNIEHYRVLAFYNITDMLIDDAIDKGFG